MKEKNRKGDSFGGMFGYFPVILMLVFMVGAALFLLTSGDSLTAEGIYERLSGSNRIVTALLIILLFAIKSMTVFVLYNIPVAAAGLLFPFWEALIINLIGTAICVSLPYFIGRSQAGGPLVKKALEKNAVPRRISESEREYSFALSLILRVLSLPSDLLGLFLGSMKISYPVFFISSMLGITPGMVWVTLLGGAAVGRGTPAFWVMLGIDAVMICIAFFVFRRKYGKIK